jgi:hypothetical protein
MGGGGPHFFTITATTNPLFVAYENNAGQPSEIGCCLNAAGSEPGRA